MHEGHHGILDGIDEEQEHKHHNDHGHSRDHNHDHSKKTLSNTLNLWKTVGVIALSVVLILLFRIILNK